MRDDAPSTKRFVFVPALLFLAILTFGISVAICESRVTRMLDALSPTTESTSLPTPEPTSVPTRVLYGNEFSQMTKAEYEWYLRNESGLGPQGIQNALANFAFNQGQARRWIERETHWQSVDDFAANVARINADGVLTAEEFIQECFTYSQWERKLKAAREYVIEFRAFDRETVETNHLDDLQLMASIHLELVNETKAACRQKGF